MAGTHVPAVVEPTDRQIALRVGSRPTTSLSSNQTVSSHAVNTHSPWYEILADFIGCATISDDGHSRMQELLEYNHRR